MKKSTSSKTFDEDEKTNCQNNSIAQYNDAAADEWKKKWKWKHDKCRREVEERCKHEKKYWRMSFKEKKELWYNNIRNYKREKFECRNFYKILHRWHDNDLEQLHEILFWIEEFFKERERNIDVSV